jgi:lipase chaperone LimK
MNAYGDFIPTPGALHLFDYYLTTLGEIDLAAIRALVAADARRFAPEQTDAVLALFDRYTTYREDLQSALSISPNLPLTDLHAVTVTRQRAHFGDDADLLFAEENALAAQLLASSSRKSRSLP